jgi:hypothetical protein
MGFGSFLAIGSDLSLCLEALGCCGSSAATVIFEDLLDRAFVSAVSRDFSLPQKWLAARQPRAFFAG